MDRLEIIKAMGRITALSEWAEQLAVDGDYNWLMQEVNALEAEICGVKKALAEIGGEDCA